MITVFKTSVFSRHDIKLLKPYLNEIRHSKWNFDLEDCDKILRIESKIEVSETIIKLLQAKGFNCEELRD